VPKQKKNSQDDELYFDIISPQSLVEEKEEIPKNKIYQIPIKKEKFSNQIKSKEKIEEIIEEPEEIIKPIKSVKEKKSFSSLKEKAKNHFKIKRFINPSGFKKKIFITSGIAVIVFSCVFVFLTYIGNKATISINTQKGSIDYAGNILIDTKTTKSDFTKNVLPGRLIKISQTVTEVFESTGKVTGGAKAKGKITIYNAYNTSPQILVQNTRFESPDGLIFKLDSRITVPGATLKNGEIVPSSIIANVTASETGTKYNISPVRFTIPGFKGTDRFNGFYGESKEKFSGGSEGESIVVSSVDLKNAEKSASDILFKKLDVELYKQIKSNEKVYKDAIVIKVVKVDFGGTKAGDSKEKFNANITGEIKTIAFPKNEFISLIKYNVEKSLQKDEELFGEFSEEIINIKPDDKNNQLTINLKIIYPTKKKINSTAIINSIKGKTIDQTKQILSNNESIEKANIKLYPIWLNIIPNVTSKIHLGID